MAKVVKFHEAGGPEEVRLRHVASGRIRIEINQRHALNDAVQAHRDLAYCTARSSS